MLVINIFINYGEKEGLNRGKCLYVWGMFYLFDLLFQEWVVGFKHILGAFFAN